MKHRIVEELNGIVGFVAGIWLVFLIDCVLPVEFSAFGLAPRHASGLPGIVTMPFLHGSWPHLLQNSISLSMLLCLLAGSRANSSQIVVAIVLLGGSLLWLFGRSNAIHIGASGLIYGLITFLIVAGFLERRLVALATAILVGLIYGATLISGVLPFAVGENVSWDGHLSGAVAGVFVARMVIRG